ncbi:hypothetical protein EDB81DRAFT_802906 [Dactylonectria macrodidyma]|uniref:Uncharacterized protein n=1 Tax=Dactylonectria macrodidyma TaxID=307937 RepID=A0A9P9E9S9_9HYPO|nr:hypothetical protein EDB81DRAFT_802906 [Dactylonectria macrodidyma]
MIAARDTSALSPLEPVSPWSSLSVKILAIAEIPAWHARQDYVFPRLCLPVRVLPTVPLALSNVWQDCVSRCYWTLAPTKPVLKDRLALPESVFRPSCRFVLQKPIAVPALSVQLLLEPVCQWFSQLVRQTAIVEMVTLAQQDSVFLQSCPVAKVTLTAYLVLSNASQACVCHLSWNPAPRVLATRARPVQLESAFLPFFQLAHQIPIAPLDLLVLLPLVPVCPRFLQLARLSTTVEMARPVQQGSVFRPWFLHVKLSQTATLVRSNALQAYVYHWA